MNNKNQILELNFDETFETLTNSQYIYECSMHIENETGDVNQLAAVVKTFTVPVQLANIVTE